MTPSPRNAVGALALTCMLLACGSSPATPDAAREDARSTQTLCSERGTGNVVLAYVRVVQPGNVAAGAQVVFENGHSFLYITDDCEYWAFDGAQGALSETRRGSLDASTARDLVAELGQEVWIDQAGYHEGPWWDASVDTIHHEGAEVSCDANCTWDEAPEDLAALFDAATRWLTRLYDEGAPATTSVRALAVDSQDEFPTWSYEEAEWSLDSSVDELVLERSALEWGVGRLFEGGDADALRALRAATKEGAFQPPFVGEFVPVRNTDGRLISVYVRDVLPFEDERGLVRFE